MGLLYDIDPMMDSVVSQIEEASLEDNLTLGFSRDEGVGLVQDNLVSRGFQVHERDSLDGRVTMTIHSSMALP